MLPLQWQQKPPYGTPLDRTNPLTAGLVELWSFAEGAGAPYGAMGVAPRPTTSSMVWTPTARGPVLANTATSHYVQMTIPSGSPLDITGPEISFGAWAYPTISNANQLLLGKELFGRQYAVMFSAAGTGAMFVGLSGTSGSSSLAVSPGWTVNAWNHVLATYDSSNVRVYINGVIANTTASTGSITTVANSTLNFGYEVANGANGLNGYLDLPAVWNRCLTPQEASAVGSSPAGLWQLFRPPRSIFPLPGGAAPAITRPASPLVVSFRRAQAWPPPRKALSVPGGNPTGLHPHNPTIVARPVPRPGGPPRRIAAPGGNPTQLPPRPAVAPRIVIPRRPRITSIADARTSPTAWPRSPGAIARPVRAGAASARPRVVSSRYVPPPTSAPHAPLVIRLPSARLARVAAILARTPGVSVAQHGPMPSAYVVRVRPGPGRPRVAQILQALYAPGTTQPITMRMNPYAAVLISEDADPLAVDPLCAVRTR